MKLIDTQFSAAVSGVIRIKKKFPKGLPIDIGAVTLTCDGRTIILDSTETDYTNLQKVGSTLSFQSIVSKDTETFPPSTEYNYELTVDDLTNKNIKGLFYIGNGDMDDDDFIVERLNFDIIVDDKLYSIPISEE